jgi:Transposase DDE domain
LRIGLNAASRKTNDLVYDRADDVEADNDELDTGTDSTTDPEAKSVRKGKRKEVELCFGGHALMENRNGLCLDIRVSSAIETEPAAAAELLKRQCRKGRKPTSLGGDKGYHGKAFIEVLRRKGIRPRFRGLARVQLHAYLVGAVYNLRRSSRLRPVTG